MSFPYPILDIQLTKCLLKAARSREVPISRRFSLYKVTIPCCIILLIFIPIQNSIYEITELKIEQHNYIEMKVIDKIEYTAISWLTLLT